MHLYACVCILCTWDAFMALLSQDLMMFNTFTSQSQTIRCSWHIFSSCDPTCVILMLPNFTLQYPEQSCIQIDHVMSKKLRQKLLMSEDKRSKLYIACFSSLLAKGPLSWLLECTAEPAQGRHRLTMCKFAVRKSYGRCKEKPWIQAQSSQTRYCTYLEVS